MSASISIFSGKCVSIFSCLLTLFSGVCVGEIISSWSTCLLGAFRDSAGMFFSGFCVFFMGSLLKGIVWSLAIGLESSSFSLSDFYDKIYHEYDLLHNNWIFMKNKISKKSEATFSCSTSPSDSDVSGNKVFFVWDVVVCGGVSVSLGNELKFTFSWNVDCPFQSIPVDIFFL